MTAHAFSSGFSSGFSIEEDDEVEPPPPPSPSIPAKAISLRIARINYADSALVSTGTAIGSLPASGLKDVDIQRIWRSTGSPDYVLADLGQTFNDIGLAALINTNALQNDIKRVRVSTSDATGVAGDGYDSGSISAAVDPVYSMLLHFIEPAVSGRYVRIDLTQSLTPEAGRLVISPTWTPSRHFSFGWEDASEDPSRKSRSLGRNLLVDVLPRERVWRFTLFGLTESEKDDELAEINRINGTHKDILICRDATASNLGKVSIWGTLDDTLRPTQIRETNLFEVEFTIRARV